MSVIWKSVGPIILLQISVAFIVIAWPILQKGVHWFGAWLVRVLPTPEAPEAAEKLNKKPFRGKWREAAYQGNSGTKNRRTHFDTPQPERVSERDMHLRALGLKSGANTAEIKRRYRKLAKAYHPDKFASASNTEADRHRAEQKMQTLNTAYDWLVANS